MNKTTEQELIRRLRKRLQLPVYLITDAEVLSKTKGSLARTAIEADIALEGCCQAVVTAMAGLGCEFKMAVKNIRKLGQGRGK